MADIKHCTVSFRNENFVVLLIEGKFKFVKCEEKGRKINHYVYSKIKDGSIKPSGSFRYVNTVDVCGKIRSFYDKWGHIGYFHTTFKEYFFGDPKPEFCHNFEIASRYIRGVICRKYLIHDGHHGTLENRSFDQVLSLNGDYSIKVDGLIEKTEEKGLHIDVSDEIIKILQPYAYLDDMLSYYGIGQYFDMYPELFSLISSDFETERKFSYLTNGVNSIKISDMGEWKLIDEAKGKLIPGKLFEEIQDEDDIYPDEERFNTDKIKFMNS